MRVLVVDDDEGIRRLIALFLGKAADCTFAADGPEGLGLYRECLDSGQPFDLVLLDIMMPGMNGRDLLGRLRDLERQRGIHRVDGVKVIMLTAMNDTKNIVGSFIQGCDGYLAKPFDDAALFEEIRSQGLLPESSSGPGS